MAKQAAKNQTAPGANPLIEAPEVHLIPLADIYASPTNPRAHLHEWDPSLEDITASIATHGVQQPILLRPRVDAQGKYEIVYGHRRYLGSKRSNKTHIPAMIREVADEDMLELQVLENLQRTNISPLDEAYAFKSLIGKQSIDWLSQRIHKPIKYIQHRIKLNDLVDKGKEYLIQDILPLGHAFMIASLEPADQDKCIAFCIEADFNKKLYCKHTIMDLRNHIDGTLTHDFGNAPFDLASPELVPVAGPCTTCIKRTKNQSLLFNDITSEDKCTDGACFNLKIKAHLAVQVKNAKQEFPKIKSAHKGVGNNEITVGGTPARILEKATRHSIPVVITQQQYGSKDLGKIVHVELQEKVAKGESWDQRHKREYTEIILPRMFRIADAMQMNHPPDKIELILRKYLLKSLTDLEPREYIPALRLINGQELKAETCYDLNHLEDKEVTKLTKNLSISQLLVLNMMLHAASDDRDERQVRWDQVGTYLKELGYAKSKTKPNSKPKK